jgi:hypothetical protein
MPRLKEAILPVKRQTRDSIADIWAQGLLITAYGPKESTNALRKNPTNGFSLHAYSVRTVAPWISASKMDALWVYVAARSIA